MQAQDRYCNANLPPLPPPMGERRGLGGKVWWHTPPSAPALRERKGAGGKVRVALTPGLAPALREVLTPGPAPALRERGDLMDAPSL